MFITDSNTIKNLVLVTDDRLLEIHALLELDLTIAKTRGGKRILTERIALVEAEMDYRTS